MMWLFNLTKYVAWILIAVLVVRAAAFLLLSWRHQQQDGTFPEGAIPKSKAGVSVLVPCFNEEMVLGNCASSLLSQSYSNLEIIIVDDGSTDNTLSIAEQLAANYGNVYCFSKSNGGKASALNEALRHATGEIVVSVDADSGLDRDAIGYLVSSFADPVVGGAGGNVKVVNRTRILGRQQSTEYISGLNLQRRSFARLGCMQVISGAIGAFRRSALLEVGGYSEDTIVEDMDVTIALSCAGYKIAYAARAIAYTEAPENLKDFIKQRYRWTFGGFQVVRKYHKVIFSRKKASMGFIGLPYFIIFPWIDVLVSLLFTLAILRTILGGSVGELVMFYAAMTAAHGSLILYAMKIDGAEPFRIPWWCFFECLWYSHLINAVTLWAGLNFAIGRTVSWNKLTRLGANTIIDLRDLPVLIDMSVDAISLSPVTGLIGPQLPTAPLRLLHDPISDDEVYSMMVAAMAAPWNEEEPIAG